MAVTPHGWHIQGSPKPAMYDEKVLAVQCGGPKSCQECFSAQFEWRIDSNRQFYSDLNDMGDATRLLRVNTARAAEGLQKERRSDAVVHPSHYNMYEGLEVIDLIEQMNFNKGNAVKYVTRAEFKGKEIEDLEKARYYLKKEIRRIKRKAKKAAKAEAKEESLQVMANHAAIDAEMTSQLYDVNSLYPQPYFEASDHESRFLADGEETFALQWRPGTPRLREFAEWIMKADVDNYVEAKGDVLNVNIPSQGVHTIVLHPTDWLILFEGRFVPKTHAQYIAMISGGLTGEERKATRKVIRPGMVRRWHAPSGVASINIIRWIRHLNPMAEVTTEGENLEIIIPIKYVAPERHILKKGDWIVHDHNGFHVLTNDEFKEQYEVI